MLVREQVVWDWLYRLGVVVEDCTDQHFVVDRARARDRATIFGASALGCNVSSLLSCSLALAQLLLVLLDEKPLGGEHAVRVAMQERKKADDRFGP